MKRVRLFAAVTTVVAVALAAPAFAMEHSGPHARARVEQLFQQSDADKDGALSKQEFEAAHLAEYGVSFETFDANSDGKVDYDEFRAGVARRR